MSLWPKVFDDLYQEVCNLEFNSVGWSIRSSPDSDFIQVYRNHRYEDKKLFFSISREILEFPDVREEIPRLTGALKSLGQLLFSSRYHYYERFKPNTVKDMTGQLFQGDFSVRPSSRLSRQGIVQLPQGLQIIQGLTPVELVLCLRYYLEPYQTGEGNPVLRFNEDIHSFLILDSPPVPTDKFRVILPRLIRLDRGWPPISPDIPLPKELRAIDKLRALDCLQRVGLPLSLEEVNL